MISVQKMCVYECALRAEMETIHLCFVRRKKTCIFTKAFLCFFCALMYEPFGQIES